MLNSPQDKLNKQVAQNTQAVNAQQAQPVPQGERPQLGIDTNPNIQNTTPTSKLQEPYNKNSTQAPEEKGGFFQQLKAKAIQSGANYLQGKIQTREADTKDRPQKNIESQNAPATPSPQAPQANIPKLQQPDLSIPKLKMPKMPKGF